MKAGVCINPYTPHGWLAPIPPGLAYLSLHTVGIRTIRVGGGPLITSARPPAAIHGQTTFDFTLMEQWLIPMVASAPGGIPWTSIYLNPGGCPPWVSEGQPAYIDENGIGVWPPGAPDVPASYCGGSWWNDPKNPGQGIHEFNQDAKRTDSVTTTSGKVLTGPELATIDQKMPARPYLIKPPHRDPQFAYDLGQAVMGDRIGGLISAVGVENEPGGGLLARSERRDGGDMLRDRMFPEVYIPFAEGVRSARPNATIVGCEADSADILERFLDLENSVYNSRPSLNVCDKITIHPYGEVRNMSYATMKAFTEVLKDREFFEGISGDRRSVSIGEIDSDPQTLYDFTEMVIANYPWIEDIYYLRPEIFYEAGSSWTTAGAWDQSKLVISAIGRKFMTLFAKMNNPNI